MGRTFGVLMAFVAGAAVVVLGPGIEAQAAPDPVLAGVSVTPSTVTTPTQAVALTVPGFPDATGCQSGFVLAVPAGGAPVDAKTLYSGDLDVPATFTGIKSFNGTPFTPGIYSITVRCTNEQQVVSSFSTTATLTITNSATTTTTTTTTTTVPSSTSSTGNATSAGATPASVDPTTAKAGVTTITVRGSGFQARASLAITLATSPVTALGTTTATDAGEYAATLKLPATAPAGDQQLVVTGPGPDGATHSTSVGLKVLAGSTSGGTSTAAGGSSGSTATSTLPKTGTERSSIEVMAGLTALTLGALLVGLSHPAVPAGGSGRPGEARRHGRRRGNHWR